MPHVSRRGLIGGTAGVAGLAAGFAGGAWYGGDRAATSDGHGARTAYPFRGAHQAGIVTPAQDRLHFAAFDVTTQSPEELLGLLRAWTSAAERLTQGRSAGPTGPTEGDYDLPPDDTGEAMGLPASGLTITFGFGPTLSREEEGRGRFGLADRRPTALEPLPHFPGDDLDPA